MIYLDFDGVLNPAYSTTPQNRHRLFVVGTLNHTVPVYQMSDIPNISVREALTELPAYGKEGNDKFINTKIVPARNPTIRPSPFAGLLFNGSGRLLDVEVPAPTLVASGGGNRTPIIDQDNLEDPTIENWAFEYLRHLRAGNPPVQTAPERLRRLTVQETIQLQGFPPGLNWEGLPASVIRQVGNSVPPPLASTVAEAVLATF